MRRVELVGWLVQEKKTQIGPLREIRSHLLLIVVVVLLYLLRRHYSAGSATTLDSRVTLVCANNLPFTVAPVTKVIAV